MGESAEQKYNRIQRDIQAAILKNYPNPERKGCPGAEVVKSFAENPDQITPDDDVNPASAWYHITHCSPCYAEFLEMRTAFRKKRIQQRLTRRAFVVGSLVLAAGGSGWYIVQRDQRRTVDINFEKYMSTRGDGDGGDHGTLTIPRGRMHVRLTLPKDSAEGLYNVQLSKKTDSTPVFSTTVSTQLVGTVRQLEFDATIDADSGSYTLGVRNDHRGVWRYCPVVLGS